MRSECVGVRGLKPSLFFENLAPGCKILLKALLLFRAAPLVISTGSSTDFDLTDPLPWAFPIV